MKIAFVSDIHLEFQEKNGFKLVEEEADVLILAGDIFVYERYMKSARHHKIVNDFFSKCNELYKNVIYVLGNHEYYSGEFFDVLPGIKEITQGKAHVLNDECITIDGVKFIGSTLWTDVNNCNPLTCISLKQAMSDFRVIRYDNTIFKPEDSYKLHTEAMNFLNREVNQDCIVVTHHAPSIKSVHQMYSKDKEMNHGFYTNLEDFIVSRPEIKYWIHGHMHNNSDYFVGNTRVMCNPIGYDSNLIQPRGMLYERVS